MISNVWVASSCLCNLSGMALNLRLAQHALAMYWKGNKVKCEIALGKGKKQHDKRDSLKQKDWQRDKQRLFKTTVR